MWLFYCLVIGVSLGMLLLILKLGKVNYKYFKKNFRAFLIYFLLLLIIFFLIFNIFESSNNNIENFINGYIIFMLSCALSIILASPIIALLQKHEEQKIIKKYEMQFKIDKFYYYRDLIGDISPAILFRLYNKNNNIEDLITVSYIYLLRKGLIKIKNDKVVNTNVLTNYSHENLLINYFRGEITKEKLKNNILLYLDQDIKNNNYIYESNEFVDFTESMQLIIIWIIITLIIMMPIFVPIGSNGIFLVVAYILAFIAIPIYKSVINSIHPLFKTEEALQIIAKLNGLERFFNEFDIINDKSIREIALYEDYILYGIIFNNKGRLNKETHELYNQIYKSAEKNKRIELKEASKMKIIDLNKNQWIVFLFTFFVTLITPCLIYLDSEAVRAPYMWLIWLMPIPVVIFALLASNQNKRKKKKERNLI